MAEIDGAEPLKQITTGEASNRLAMWSPDGSKIAFQSDRAGSQGIWVKNADGTGTAIHVTAGITATIMADWSSDGRWIAFVSDDTVFVKSSDGTGDTIEIGAGLEPRWSPDGEKLAYVGWEEDQYEIQIMDLPEELR